MKIAVAQLWALSGATRLAEGGSNAPARVHVLEGECATECAQHEPDLLGFRCGLGVVPQELVGDCLQGRGAKRQPELRCSQPRTAYDSIPAGWALAGQELHLLVG
jgi:hypothetical protein